MKIYEHSCNYEHLHTYAMKTEKAMSILNIWTLNNVGSFLWKIVIFSVHFAHFWIPNASTDKKYNWTNL